MSTAGNGSAYTEMIEWLSSQADEIIEELPEGAEFRKAVTSEDLTFSISRAASGFSDDDEKRQWLSQILNSYVNVLRPRLKEHM